MTNANYTSKLSRPALALFLAAALPSCTSMAGGIGQKQGYFMMLGDEAGIRAYNEGVQDTITIAKQPEGHQAGMPYSTRLERIRAMYGGIRDNKPGVENAGK